MTKKHKITVVVGDWSQDGHNLTESFTVESNLSKEEVEKAYKKGTKALKVSIADLCNDYSDNAIPKLTYNKFVSLKPSIEELGWKCEEDDKDGIRRIGPDEFAEMYFVTVKAGNKNFKWTYVKSGHIHIGGYGLFE